LRTYIHDSTPDVVPIGRGAFHAYGLGVRTPARSRAILFGQLTRPARPVLLFIVYGIFLVIVGVTATAQTVLVSLNYSSSSLQTIVGGDAGTVRTFVNGYLRPADLSGEAPPSRIETIERGLNGLVRQGELLRIEIRDPGGIVRFSNDGSGRNEPAPSSAGFETARAGMVDAGFVGDEQEYVGPTLAASQLLREYFPLLDGSGAPQGVVAIWRDAGPIFAALDGVRTQVVLVTISAALLAAVFLYFIFRSAQGRITRQTEQILESSRRDPLTSTLNHGALVGELAVRIEEARNLSSTVVVALIDLDNFKLLNDTYGHEAGDLALNLVARHLAEQLPAGVTYGRYGPDEFLAIATGDSGSELLQAVESVRGQLVDENLQVEASERLPISISAGIAAFPEHAMSVTELLSSVAVVLAEARSSGGDAVRVAGRTPEKTAETRSFDVLQGLVFAVDTKDRYTKRHSEDVARYATFLARRLGLDESFLKTIHDAGLLHDVGKIGIPDTILRKPAKLTDEEYQIVKQHVALGDAIVRDLDRLEDVRAGIRHHHERWDGRGYLHALAGEDIPLIARILAVGDAFSAMTTTRPYRKALTIEEALRRLGDAAGTQLDERLVSAFVTGIEEDAGAPLPTPAITPHRWISGTQVA
jgi:diguanylate cyclase (GGDEF)-like protein/putative nucleotidyltransferase with HDIG domain